MRSWLVLGAVMVSAVWGGTARPAEHFVAVDGLKTNPGTMQRPWDIASALDGTQKVAPGDTIWLRGGTYRHPERAYNSPGYVISLKGAKDDPIHVRPWKGERVTIDGNATVRGAERLWLWDVEFTLSETAGWDRRLAAGGSLLPGDTRPVGGINILTGVECKFIGLVAHNNSSTGISFWRYAIDSELHGCLIYQNGGIGPDRYHGPGIYTQNETGEKWITDCILWGNYSTTIQAYGSANAFVDHFRIIGNVSFAPLKAGQRQRILIGGGRPSKDIVARENILYEVPLQLGYGSTAGSEGAVVADNVVVRAGISVNGYNEGTVKQEKNFVWREGQPRPDAPQVFLRPNKYDPDRANLAVLNWPKKPTVEVDLGAFLKPGDAFRIQNALDYFGEPAARGTFDGKSVAVPVPVEERTGGGEFCAYVLFRNK